MGAAQNNSGRTSQGGLEEHECKEKCYGDEKCKGFSYRTEGKVCFWFITQKCDAGQAVPGNTACDADWCNYDKCEACVGGWVKRSQTCSHAAQNNSGRTSQGGLEEHEC